MQIAYSLFRRRSLLRCREGERHGRARGQLHGRLPPEALGEVALVDESVEGGPPVGLGLRHDVNSGPRGGV